MAVVQSIENNKSKYLIIYKTLNRLNAIYGSLFLLGYFDVEPEEKSISEFFSLRNLKNLVKENTWFKNPD